MYKFLLLIILFGITFYSAHGQIDSVYIPAYTDLDIDSVYVEADTINIKSLFDTAFSQINTSYVTTGTLMDKVLLFADPDRFSGTTATVSTASLSVFQQLYFQFRQASIMQPAIPLIDTLYARARRCQNQGRIPIAILAGQYNQIRDNAIVDSLLFWNNGKLYDNPNRTQSPYQIKKLFIAVPFTDSIVGSQVQYTIDSSLYITNSNEPLQSLNINFGDGNGYQAVNIGDNKTIYYTSGGTKTILIQATYPSGVYYASSSIEVNFVGNMFISGGNGPDFGFQLTASRPYTGGSGNPYASGYVEVYLGCGNSAITKPFIIVEGFDPQNNIWPSQIVYYLNEPNRGNGFMDALRSHGYDIIILNFWNGSDYIQRNAYLLEKLIETVNAYPSVRHELVVLGLSMGGLVARYALADMEKRNEKHNTRLYISFDAPHQGAYIPVGIQAMARYYDFELSSQINNKDFLDQINQLNSPAARQMLKVYVKSPQTNVSQMKIETPQERTTLMNELATLGYPQQLRKIAVTNGSSQGTRHNYGSSAEYFRMDIDHMKVQAGLTAYIDVRNRLKTLPSYSDGQSSVFYSQIDIHTLFDFPILYKSFNFKVPPTSSEAFESFPGGYMDSFKKLRDGMERGFSSQVADSRSFTNNGRENHCFIGTGSALDVKYVTSSGQIVTPFDKYYWSSYNTPHVLSLPVTAPAPRAALDDLLDDILSSELNREQDVYVQNTVINTNKNYEALNQIIAGKNVTTSIPYGNVVVESGTKVDFHAGQTIRLKDGFRAKSGTIFHAYIAPFPSCTYSITQINSINAKTGEDDLQEHIEQPVSDRALLSAPYPNPFGDETSIDYTITEAGPVTLVVSNMFGQVVAEIVRNSHHAVGTFQVRFNAGTLPSGTYFYTLRAGEYTQTKQMMIVR
jgi:hypothetical protein